MFQDDDTATVEEAMARAAAEGEGVRRSLVFLLGVRNETIRCRDACPSEPASLLCLRVGADLDAQLTAAGLSPFYVRLYGDRGRAVIREALGLNGEDGQ